MSTPTGYPYQAPFEAQFDDGRQLEYVIKSLIGRIHTATLVRVLAVRPAAGKVGFVDVQPLLLDVDTSGAVVEQSPVYNVPFTQLQGGSSAVILAPVVDDIGLCIFAERDITNIKTTQKEGPPNTQRQFSSADGLYIGGVLNADPTQYIKFQPNGAGIDIVTPGEATLQAAGNITVQAALCTFKCPVVFEQSVNSTATAGGSVQFASPIVAPDAIIGGVTQSTHVHGGVQPGGGNSGGPHN